MGAGPGFQDFEEAVALEEFEHGGGFAAGHDEAVEAFEVLRCADEASGGAERGEGLHMRVIGALQGENAYNERPGRLGHLGVPGEWAGGAAGAAAPAGGASVLRKSS
jgi:hypothetical protein